MLACRTATQPVAPCPRELASGLGRYLRTTVVCGSRWIRRGSRRGLIRGSSSAATRSPPAGAPATTACGSTRSGGCRPSPDATSGDAFGISPRARNGSATSSATPGITHHASSSKPRSSASISQTGTGGSGTFTDELIHASRYRNVEPYRHRDVLVVSAGVTGSELAFFLAEGGAARVRRDRRRLRRCREAGQDEIVAVVERFEGPRRRSRRRRAHPAMR